MALEHFMFLSSLSMMFNNPRMSDVTVKIHDVVLPAHLFVLCLQSDYFKVLFENKNGQGFIETKTRSIEFNEGSGAAYWRVFEYFYKGDYSDILPNIGFEDDPDHIKHVRVYALADMFLVDNLKVIAEEKFREEMRDGNVTETFPDCVREVYSHSPAGNNRMRAALVDMAIEHGKRLVKDTTRGTPVSLLELDYFAEIIGAGGDFPVDYLRSFEENARSPNMYYHRGNFLSGTLLVEVNELNQLRRIWRDTNGNIQLLDSTAESENG